MSYDVTFTFTNFSGLGTLMDNEKLPRREREKLRQREEMLSAALTLFAEKGYHNVCMHEIAAKAEFAIGTLYKFFQNKEELYKALVLEQVNAFSAAFREAISVPGNEVEKLRSYVRTKSEMFRRNVSFIRLYMAESKGERGIKTILCEELKIRYFDFLDKLAAVFESGIRNKRFNNIASPYNLAVALDSTTDNLFLFWLDSPERHPFPDDPDSILDILFKGLINP